VGLPNFCFVGWPFSFFSFQTTDKLSPERFLGLLLTFSICYVGDFVDASLSTDENLASE
jgi:hypothetical protein